MIIVVIRIKRPCHHELLVVVYAGDTVRLGLGLGQRRQQHASENRDNRNNHQQLNQGETVSLFHGELCFHWSQIHVPVFEFGTHQSLPGRRFNSCLYHSNFINST